MSLFFLNNLSSWWKGNPCWFNRAYFLCFKVLDKISTAACACQQSLQLSCDEPALFQGHQLLVHSHSWDFMYWAKAFKVCQPIFLLQLLYCNYWGTCMGLAGWSNHCLGTIAIDAWYFHTLLRQPLYEDPRYKNLTHRHAWFRWLFLLRRIFSCEELQNLLHQSLRQFILSLRVQGIHEFSCSTAHTQKMENQRSKFEDTKISIDGLVVTLNSRFLS